MSMITDSEPPTSKTEMPDPRSRDEFIYYLFFLREKIEGVAPVKVWLRMEIELGRFTKTDDMKFTSFPPGEPTVFPL